MSHKLTFLLAFPFQRNKTRFQNKVGAIMDFHAPVLLEYVHSIKFPDFWDPTKVTQEQVSL